MFTWLKKDKSIDGMYYIDSAFQHHHQVVAHLQALQRHQDYVPNREERGKIEDLRRSLYTNYEIVENICQELLKRR